MRTAPALAPLLLLFVESLVTVLAWGTLYTSTNDAAYLHLRNNAVLQIFADNAGSPNRLPDPPNNASLVLTLDNRLLAFYGTSFCEGLNIVEYYSKDNAWKPVIVAGFEPNYLSQSIYMASPSSDLVFIYGGRNLSSACHTSYIQDPSTIYDSRTSYVVSNQIKVFNVTDNTYRMIKTASSPTAMFAAGVMRMPFSSSSLLVGGKAQNGWIGMNQLAMWEYSSWTFISTANSAHVDSRTNPLVLPLKSAAGQPSSKATNSTLILGGRVNSHISLPYTVGMSLDPVNGWSWNADLDQSFISSTDKILGAVTFENTLITITDKNSDTEDLTDVIERRDTDLNYDINYFDTATWTKADGFTPSTDSSDTLASESTSAVPSSKPSETGESSPSSSTTTTKKIALSTVLPVSVFFVSSALVAIFLYRRKKRKNEDLIPAPRPLNLSPYLGGASSYEQQMLNGQSNGHDRDTASFQSWTEKRRVYEEQEHLQHHPQHYPQPYMPINGQNGRSSSDLGIVSIGEGSSDYDSPFENIIHHDENIPLQQLPSLDYQPQPRRASTIRQASESIVNYFKGKRSVSSATAPASYLRSTSAASFAQDISDMRMPHSSLGRHEETTTGEDDEFFEGRDVQILVSSKRRTRLRVVNPDPDTPSRNNSDHSTIASLNVKKQRAGRYAPLVDHAVGETGVVLRRASSTSIAPSVQTQSSRHQEVDITEVLEEAEKENDLGEARVGTRAVSSGSAYAWRREHE